MKKNNRTNKHKVPAMKSRVRLSDYCGNVFQLLGSKSATKKAIAAKNILLNGRIANTGDYVRAGDVIELKRSNTKKIKKIDIDIEIVYEDEYLVVVNKPGGIAVNGNRYTTVENAVVHLKAPNHVADALPQPVAVHRIDVPTKGLVILAKTKTALINMSRLFQENKVDKAYVAVVHGESPESGTIQQAISGKNAVTNFTTERVVPSRFYKHLSLVKMNPITGRTHQLRIHMKDAGYLILGDKQYAKDTKTLLGKGLFLCATTLKFKHPITDKEMKLHIPTPRRFERVLDREAARF